MARVFKHTYTTKDEYGESVSRKTRKWYIEYRDADGVNKRVPGFYDKKVTEQKAAELERYAERRQSGLIDGFAEHRKRPISEHIGDYEAHLVAKHVCELHKAQTLRRSSDCVKACGFSHLQDIQSTPVER